LKGHGVHLGLLPDDTIKLNVRPRKLTKRFQRMTAATASCQDSKWNSTGIVAPANAQTNSGQFHSRAITPSVAAAGDSPDR
jgi:hypothetical protein